MNRPLLLVAVVMALCLFTAYSQAAANAEPMDMDPAILSKLALERAKTRLQSFDSQNAGRASTGLDSPAAECGSVNIGNVITGGKPGFQPREVTVVITGDVINANNNCH